ncbi:hypothetical protein TIFTF001_022420 [Ficus carica]|uniref:Uncharacterized protein n=1 Tax=Ficus carica TaxID=3494 RepID=A0AA88AVS9_FICCA|nr:hypothetical protein TIFTF001_022420 [Ficus carica]
MRPLLFSKIKVSSTMKPPGDSVVDDHQQPCTELNLLRCFSDYSPRPEMSNSSNNGAQMDKKVAGMNTNFRALGGHQNAHKQERALLKREYKGIKSISTTSGDSFDVLQNIGTTRKPLGVHSRSVMIHKPSSFQDHGRNPNYWSSPTTIINDRWPIIRAPVLNLLTTILPPPQYLLPARDGRFRPAVVAGYDVDGPLAMAGDFFSHIPGLGSMAYVSHSSRISTHEGSSLELDLSLKL